MIVSRSLCLEEKNSSRRATPTGMEKKLSLNKSRESGTLAGFGGFEG